GLLMLAAVAGLWPADPWRAWLAGCGLAAAAVAIPRLAGRDARAGLAGSLAGAAVFAALAAVGGRLPAWAAAVAAYPALLAISIEQKTTSKNPRSTVGTVTEIYDYLRVLFARVGVPHCPSCGRPISAQTVQQMVDRVMAQSPGTRLLVLAPVVRGRKGEYKKLFFDLQRQGFTRVRVNGAVRELGEEIEL